MFGKSSHSRLRFLLKKYKKGLQELELNSSWPPQQILNLLLLRDAIQKLIESDNYFPTSIIHELANYDQQLQQQKDYIIILEEYNQWREVIQRSQDAWWWNWEVSLSTNWGQLLDGLWNGLTLICLGISTSLIIDAIPRILSGGVDQFSALSIIIPSLLTLLTSGQLTIIGQQARDYLGQKISFFSDKRNFLSLVFSAILVIILVVIHQNFSHIATYFNQEGLQHYHHNKLDQALSNYNRAIAFNPDDGEAHYNLGVLYEDLQQFDKAKLEYQIAGQQGDLLIRLKAYNNLGRLFLLDKKYQEAISPLLEGYNAIDEEKVSKDEKFKRLKYAIYKNLGWANLGLKNYVEAKLLLDQAKLLYKDKGASYCLLAQVLEGQKNNKEALKYWNNCITYGDNKSSEEYLWMSIAREKVRE